MLGALRMRYTCTLLIAYACVFGQIKHGHALPFSPAIIIQGATLAHGFWTLLKDQSYAVTVGIQVENWTKFVLDSPTVYLHAGKAAIPPTKIQPSTSEAMVFHKTGWYPSGSEGLVSWLFGNRRVYVMWSAPYSSWYSNWLGVGLSVPPYADYPGGSALFNQMYNGQNTTNIKFNRGEYDKELPCTKIVDGEFEVAGTMGTSRHPEVKIVVLPRSANDLADAAKAELQQQGDVWNAEAVLETLIGT